MLLPLSTGACAGISIENRANSFTPQAARLSIRTFLLQLFSFVVTLLCINRAFLSAQESDRDSTSLRLLDAKPSNAAIFSCDKNWKLTFIPDDADSRTESVSASDLYFWGSWRAAGTGQQLLLRDGGRVIGYLDSLDANEIKFDSTAGLESIVIPRKSARGIVFKPSIYKKFAANEQDGENLLANQARVILANGDQQSGEIVSWAANKLTLKTFATRLTLDQSNLAAVLFAHESVAEKKITTKESSQSPSRVWLGFQDGSRILANQLELINEKWNVVLTGGGRITADQETLCAIQPTNGRVTYLSDIEANGYKHIPWLSTTWEYKRDRNVLGQELQCNGKAAIKGLGMHSAARLSYNLDAAYDALIGQIGIDDSTRGRGSVVCKVYLDTGDGKWQLKSESPILRGGQRPFDLNVDLRGAKRISLLVDYADGGDTLDHVDWLNLALVRTKK